jgi:hypothetical protein
MMADATVKSTFIPGEKNPVVVVVVVVFVFVAVVGSFVKVTD